MRFGSTKTTNQYGEDGSVTDIELIHENDNVGSFKQYKVRHLVHNNQEQTMVYTKFVNEITDMRLTNKLAILKDDPTTMPTLTIKYPKTNVDGSFIVYTSWTERI